MEEDERFVMECPRCGYKEMDVKILYGYGDETCKYCPSKGRGGGGCGCIRWQIWECPQCGTKEMHQENQQDWKVKNLCKKIKELVGVGDMESAVELWREAVELNEVEGLKQEGEYLASLRKEMRKMRRKRNGQPASHNQ